MSSFTESKAVTATPNVSAAAPEETLTNIDDHNDSKHAAAAAVPLTTTATSTTTKSVGQRRKDMFGDCALVEIIHLHDCLRGALKALEKDVSELSDMILDGATIKTAGGGGTGGGDPMKIIQQNSSINGNNAFQQQAQQQTQEDTLSDLERRVAGRFKVIWSVFRAHSSAEDEFIWPTLQSKTQGRVKGSPKYDPSASASEIPTVTSHTQQQGQYNVGVGHQHQHQQQQQSQLGGVVVSAVASTSNSFVGDATVKSLPPPQQQQPSLSSSSSKRLDLSSVDSYDEGAMIEQEEYEEDHADEERMFSFMDDLLTKLRDKLVQQKQQQQQSMMMMVEQKNDAAKNEETLISAEASSPPTATTTTAATTTSTVIKKKNNDDEIQKSIHNVMKEIHKRTQMLSQHLFSHLAKEEKQCLPLVIKHLSKSEIHDLVGKIMGKRSSDMIAQIMTMAVQNLNQNEREEMVQYMKQAMEGTFFDRWLSMSGWMNDNNKKLKDDENDPSHSPGGGGGSSSEKRPVVGDAPAHVTSTSSDAATGDNNNNKRIKIEPSDTAVGPAAAAAASLQNIANQNLPFLSSAMLSNTAAGITSQAELEKLIRAIATNPNLSAQQKNTTIQGLRDSVWKSNQRLKAATTTGTPAAANNNGLAAFASSNSNVTTAAAVSAATTSVIRQTPPASYYKKNATGKLCRVWESGVPGERCVNDGTVPFFSASELAPTYHDGATGAVLGCPHYARACKLRHPLSGRLYTCRLCCEQEREMPSKDQDEHLDRYAVTEVMCMKCNTLQPADDRCVNPACESQGKPFAKYFCRICHLYDDRSRPIYHCPYCNTCRMGLGLGIDFRHCMRCNACVSLADSDHRCIPQKLQGSCPICHESLFQSTMPLKGLKCGHVLHLSCFMEYRRGQRYTCPLCMRSMEDMSEYFALLDAAVRMQPMPNAYLSTFSNVYCQDCEKTGQCRYHFVGQKCPHCGSYNTRELGRVHH